MYDAPQKLGSAGNLWRSEFAEGAIIGTSKLLPVKQGQQVKLVFEKISSCSSNVVPRYP